jgi:cysteine desulfurase/selenocysteine lyase
MRRVYLDNAATSFPKPPAVLEAMVRYSTDIGASARGAYDETRRAGAIVRRCRELIARLVGLASPEHVVFTLNTSDALNVAIKGVVHHALRTARARPHLVTTQADHNSVLRPFNALCERHGLTQTRLPVDPRTCTVDPDDLRRALTPGTVLVAVNHASNVTGALQPAGEIGRIVKQHSDALYLVDGAQSLGHVPVGMNDLHADLLAFPGHKGLLGPTGTGGLCVRPGVEVRMETLREGGTGLRSELEDMPAFMPDRFEPGSHNTLGIAGLAEGVAYLLSKGLPALRAHEVRLMEQMIAGLTDPALGLHLLGPTDPDARVGVFSFTHPRLTPQDIGRALEARGVLSRAGLHCAPLMHQALGTHGALGTHASGDAQPAGAARLSIGPFNTGADIQQALGALREVCAAPCAPAPLAGARGA